ncbi:MAG: NifB/NifX family molybdenum-iron cluster-binding protein [Phaeodactylibacter xiamenensis]|uniref:Uncharacterized protein n=1 Tax=Phaeodactylibacter xiamenensis TaxID=1524460 RepID=A0A098SAG7_9BACT|nr:NifB/NifX family molybdenum-iron cluster-binding protein [Phaeodactylibacter xiamenensis]KGE89131.1 hypothetical protein IX84_05010 [Phaeodactylibacter xiamenensis]MCR9050336.1 hypothetical protein [bacterium]
MFIAIATDGQGHIPRQHFGEASHFEIIELKDGIVTPFKTISNVQQHHSGHGQHGAHHGSGGKAKEIIRQLKSNGVSLLAGQQFGPNIKKICAHFGTFLTTTPYVQELQTLMEANAARLEGQMLEPKDGCYPLFRIKSGTIAIQHLKGLV